MLSFILEENHRELAGTGTRWYTMRRLSVDPLFEDVTYTHTIYSSEDGSVLETFTLNPDRFVIRLPLNILTTNPNLPQNN